jgi:hypothetical protein
MLSCMLIYKNNIIYVWTVKPVLPVRPSDGESHLKGCDSGRVRRDAACWYLADSDEVLE